MYTFTASRDKELSKNLNSVCNSDKLKNSAAPSSGEFFSLSTGAAENFIFKFLVLRVLSQFLISRDVIMLYMGPTLAWADDMEAAVKGAKLETTTTYIGHVQKELPRLLREKVGTGHADWGAFLQAVQDIDTDHIRDGVDTWKKDQEVQDTIRKRIQQLEKLSASPTAPLRQQMTSFNIGNSLQAPQQATNTLANPFASNTGGHC
jgi:hypothetical protein